MFHRDLQRSACVFEFRGPPHVSVAGIHPNVQAESEARNQIGIGSYILTSRCVQFVSPKAAVPQPRTRFRASGQWWLSTPGMVQRSSTRPTPSLYIFAEGHYTAVYVPGAEPRVLGAEISFQPTAEEMVVQHESIIVNAGTYKVRGSTVTVDPLIVKSPGFVGDLATSEPQINRGHALADNVADRGGVWRLRAQCSRFLTLSRLE